VDRKQLEIERAALLQQRESHLANFHRASGALAVIENLLAKAVASEAAPAAEGVCVPMTVEPTAKDRNGKRIVSPVPEPVEAGG
jgi:hypothetical protein